jgi:O-antigen ligase
VRSIAPGLDACLVAVAAAIALQLVPLPAAVIDRVSPAARGVWQQFSLGPVTGPLPITIRMWSTLSSLTMYAMALGVFLVGRQAFAQGGVRVAVRGVATIGLVLSAESLAQRATAGRLIYWHWRTDFQVVPPFGPFLNPDHFATWTILAIPLTLGYLLAHASAHHHEDKPKRWQDAVVRAMDGRSIWLTTAICFMLIALAMSLSRAAWAGLAAGLAMGAALRREERLPAGWIVIAAVLAAAGIAVLVAPGALIERLASAGSAASGRVNVWRATLPIIRDFWLTGTGAGTFETVMLSYQRVPSLFRINAAHNHYLQVAAEGGLLVGVPVALALAAFARRTWHALLHDDSTMYLVRLGAFSALVATAVQSVWETGLATPANALLAALVAAIALHRPQPAGTLR